MLVELAMVDGNDVRVGVSANAGGQSQRWWWKVEVVLNDKGGGGRRQF